MPYGKKHDDEIRARIRDLWEGSPELSATDIGERVGMTKNAILGLAHRGGWSPRILTEVPRTLFDRMDAEHARMDAVLAETRQ
jgi:hypothetical protein